MAAEQAYVTYLRARTHLSFGLLSACVAVVMLANNPKYYCAGEKKERKKKEKRMDGKELFHAPLFIN